MRAQDLVVSADVGVGNGAASVWTCDLTYAYVRINADYRS
jgi:glutamate N-acetyltransferase/amino-acid N-acetyltransferase